MCSVSTSSTRTCCCLGGKSTVLKRKKNRACLLDSKQPILDRYCGKDPPFDLVFLDGGEYYGRAEFLEVLSKCKPRVLALHDISSFKNYDARETLLRASKSGAANAYKLLRENTEGAGYAVFERV